MKAAKSNNAISLIILAFDALSKIEPETFSKADISHLREAKKITSEQFNPAPTINQIAKQVGTCETKLKQGFKQLFGETIFQCRNRYRMEKAMSLIEQGLPIAEIANLVGYGHQASFTNAFRNYFGVNPKDSRKIYKPDGKIS